MPVAINGVDKQGVAINGVQVKQALDAANETVAKGVYDPTTLSAVDADLATPNIKSGKDIFGKPGSADVRDSTDADAAVTDVKDPKTFFAGGGARKTGTMPTRTLDPASENVPAGYYEATTLSAVDEHLAPANIKQGVNIFGKVGTLAPGGGKITRITVSQYIGYVSGEQEVEDKTNTAYVYVGGAQEWSASAAGDHNHYPNIPYNSGQTAYGYVLYGSRAKPNPGAKVYSQAL